MRMNPVNEQNYKEEVNKMSDFEVIHRSRLDEILAGNAEFEDASELEDALIALDKAKNEIEHFKNLKKRRAAFYDSAIKESDEKHESIRTAVQEYMKKSNNKTLKFPGVGTASVRTLKGKWEIEDEDKLLEHIESLDMSEGIVKMERKLDKKQLNKVLEELDTNNNLGDAVKRGEGSSSLTVKFDEALSSRIEAEVPAPTAPVKKSVSTDVSDVEI